MPEVMPDGLQVAQCDLAPAGVAEDHSGQGETEEGDPADGLPGARPMGRSPGVCPGRGLRKLRGTSVGSSSCSCTSSSTRWASVSPMPMRAPQHSSIPWRRTRRQVSARSSQVWVVTMRGRTSATSRRCGCSGAPRPRPAAPPVPRSGAGAHRHVEPGLLVDEGTSSRIRRMVRSSGPRTASTMQNSEAPSGGWVSRAAPRTSSVSRNGVALTGVSKRDDCEQKWQSSGQPPVLAERMPSTSTSGPHQARRTWWASEPAP
jgi:hypothetical protein